MTKAPASPRELQAFAAYCEAESLKLAAYRLGIKPNTVKNHVAALYSVLDVSNAFGAAKALGWLRVPPELVA